MLFCGVLSVKYRFHEKCEQFAFLFMLNRYF